MSLLGVMTLASKQCIKWMDREDILIQVEGSDGIFDRYYLGSR